MQRIEVLRLRTGVHAVGIELPGCDCSGRPNLILVARPAEAYTPRVGFKRLKRHSQSLLNGSQARVKFAARASFSILGKLEDQKHCRSCRRSLHDIRVQVEVLLLCHLLLGQWALHIPSLWPVRELQFNPRMPAIFAKGMHQDKVQGIVCMMQL